MWVLMVIVANVRNDRCQRDENPAWRRGFCFDATTPSPCGRNGRISLLLCGDRKLSKIATTRYRMIEC